MRGVLSTSVTVKDEFCFWVSLCPCHFESRCDQLGAVLSGYFVCDNFAGKQIQNHTGVKIELPQLKTSNIADPDLVGLVRLKLLLEAKAETGLPIVTELMSQIGRAHV